MPFQILIADDHIHDETDEIARLPAMLREAGYEVRTTPRADQVYDLVWEYRPDLILLDIVFQGQEIDGLEICRAIRQNGSDIPIILVTALMTDTEQVLHGFRVGADDYVTRPRDNREIMARIRANLPPETIVVDEYLLLGPDRSVWVCRQGRWHEVHLQRLQFELLNVLVLNAERIVLTTTLKDRVWGKPVSDAALAVYIHRLRKKVEPDPDRPVYIESIRSLGYRFNGRPRRASLSLLQRGCSHA